MIRAAIRGYHRSRGWLAWHVAYLSRLRPEYFPPLEAMMNVRAEGPRQTPEQQVSAVRQWKSVLAAMSRASKE